MSSSDDFTIEQSDIEKLNDKDKAELRQFFSNEQQRTRIQSRAFFPLLFHLSPHNAQPSPTPFPFPFPFFPTITQTPTTDNGESRTKRRS